MAATSSLERLLRTVRSQESKDRAHGDELDLEIARLERERVGIDARLERHKAIQSKLEVHAATKSQLETDIAQLDEDIRKQCEKYRDFSDGSLLKKVFRSEQPLIRPLISQREAKLRSLRDLEIREPGLFDEIDAEDIYLPESTPSDDGSGDVDHGGDRGSSTTDDPPDTIDEQAVKVLPRQSAPNHKIQKKRRRSQREDTPRKVSRLADRTIDISIFFQDGKSKHRIFRANGDEENWWIVWCKEHSMTFTTKNPLAGAGKHLHSDRHGSMDKSNETALAHLGYKVLNCNPQLAEENNLALDAELENRGSHAPHKSKWHITVSGGGDDGTADFVPEAHVEKPMKRRADTSSQAVLDPIPGHIYLAWISQDFRGAFCLPLPPTVEGTGDAELQAHTEDLVEEMKKEPPACYTMRNGRFVWAKDYEDHGSRVQERQHPVVIINNDNRTKWTRAWIPAKNLREVGETDPSLHFVANRSAVLRELERRNRQDEGSPVAGLGEGQTSGVQGTGNGDPEIKTQLSVNEDNPQPAAEPDTAGESPTPDRSRGRQGSAFSTRRPEDKNSATCYPSFRGSTTATVTDESVGGENKALRRFSIKIGELLT
ncbi:uncharacterized protein F5Z01DRAFT_753454 [Emericellopsis atlantica]|uniref:Uncharacterized protein n=1 Tax=Emericellopsis atlantica TaxID=2614577 RepID=A0A9P7ZES4_9HYPO|nr:uncharacterized protein F5Z01DRAFT_753454 [Emericellopsis atlantica]KAG9250616.1 hypothetical protein F5Z01DRAFT_753454 [Emericellopsis atlantica]